MKIEYDKYFDSKGQGWQSLAPGTLFTFCEEGEPSGVYMRTRESSGSSWRECHVSLETGTVYTDDVEVAVRVLDCLLTVKGFV